MLVVDWHSLSATGEVITKLHEASLKDLDAAVDAAEKAFNTTWGLNIGGAKRGQLLMKLAEIVEAHTQELAAIESLDNGMFHNSFPTTIQCAI
jgi:aldehyde dehydrogenase (NAD+)